MKTTSDGKQVPGRCWYYLLEFNEADDWKTMEARYDTKRLHDLNIDQFWNLFTIATGCEESRWIKQIQQP